MQILNIIGKTLNYKSLKWKMGLHIDGNRGTKYS